MKNINSKTPTQANYRILELIEQIAGTMPKGTALGMSDVMSAMMSGYFIETGGAITPAVEAYLRREIKDEKERAARTRRAAKAITYGSYNLTELMKQVSNLIEAEAKWQPTRVQGYRIKAVDFTPYRRQAVKQLKAKAYISEANRAVAAVSVGLIVAVGVVEGQRVALMKNATVADLSVNDEPAHKKKLYKAVEKGLEKDEIAVFDAGFRLVEAVGAGITRCFIRLPKNCTFGKTVGKIPERTSNTGREPTQYKADIVRPLARQHGDKLIEATEPDETCLISDERGRELEVQIWHNWNPQPLLKSTRHVGLWKAYPKRENISFLVA